MQLGVLVVELPWEAEIVAESARRHAIAERVMVPQPPDIAGGVGNLMRRAKVIGRDIEWPGRLERRDRQIAQPHRFRDDAASAVVAASQAARFVIDEELRRHLSLDCSLTET